MITVDLRNAKPINLYTDICKLRLPVGMIGDTINVEIGFLLDPVKNHDRTRV